MAFDMDAHLLLTDSGGNEQRMDRTNTSYFSFLGNLALYNHIFIVSESQTSENPDATTGMYIFTHSPVFKQLFNFAAEQQFPGVVNQLEVPQCDLDAYDRSVQGLVGDVDHIPEDWANGEA